MLIHPKFTYVANPRTASRATEALLKQILGSSCVVTEQHHPKTDHQALRRDVPVYGAVRSPLDWIVSWYHHCKKPKPFREFVSYYNNGWLYKDRLAIYAPYITHFLNLDVLGVEGIVRRIVGRDEFLEWESGGDGLAPVIGRTGPEPQLWDDRLAQAARTRFPVDFLLNDVSSTEEGAYEVGQGDQIS